MRTQFSLVILFLVIVTGCSNGNPVTPLPDNNPGLTPDVISSANQISSTGIMGPYELSIDTISGTAELVPKRLGSIGESFIVSGESFFVTQPCSDCLIFNGIGMDSKLVRVKMRIKHPFDKGDPSLPPTGKNRLDLDIFDTALVVVPLGMTPTHYGRTDVGIYHEILHEQHGFTTELTNITGDPAAMPYILVVDDSDPDNPGNTFNKFEMGASKDIEFVIGLEPDFTLQFDLYLTFGYGASATFLERLNPQYYNPEFNRKAAWKVEATPLGKWLSFNSIIDTHVEVRVYDWQISANVDPALTNPTDVYAASEIQQVSVDIPGMNFTLPFVTGDQYIQGTGLPYDPLIYQVPVCNERTLSAGLYTGLVKVTDERLPQLPSEGRDFLIDSPDGKTLDQFEMTEYSTFQTFTAEVISTLEFNLVDVTPPWLYFYPLDICVYGDYVYTAGDLHGVHIFNISNPEDPVWINKVEIPKYPVAVFAADDYLYVANDDDVVIVDISNPAYARIVGTIVTSDDAKDVFVSGNFAYVADEEDGLQIADISDPTWPLMYSAVDTDGLALGVYVSGDYAYVADFDYGLQIIDVSTPSTASIVGEYDTDDDAYAVSVLGDHAYVVTDGELEIINVNPPASANNINTISLDYPRSIYISGDYAYIADDDEGMKVIDISSPGSEAIVKTVDTPYLAYSLYGSDGYIYLVDYEKALHVIDIDPLSSADIVESIFTVSYAGSVDVSGDYAYVVTSWDGLFIFNINPPGGLEVVGHIDTPGIAADVGVSGDYTYVADRHEGLQVIDVSDPALPAIIANLNTLGDVYALDIEGDYAYLAALGDGFHVIDISTPLIPGLECTVSLGGNANDVCVYGDLACVTTSSPGSGLHIIDISIPSVAFVANTVPTGNSHGVSCNSQTAVVGDYYGVFDIIDYNPPGSASILTSIPTAGNNNRSEIYQGRAFAVNTSDDLVIIDINPPASAFIADTFDLLGFTRDIKISNGYAYIAAGSGGLRIIDLW